MSHAFNGDEIDDDFLIPDNVQIGLQETTETASNLQSGAPTRVRIRDAGDSVTLDTYLSSRGILDNEFTQGALQLAFQMYELSLHVALS